jgi:hypothetical protein
MGLDLNKAEVGDLTNHITDYSVANKSLDSATGEKEFSWSNTKFTQYMGYYKAIPELRSAIDTKALWAVGKGFKADEETKKKLSKIKGWGKDTFNSIIENGVRTYNIGGDFFAEIVRDGKEIINLKPMNAGDIKIIVDEKGMLLRYEQGTGIEKPTIKFMPEDIFHLCWNRIGNEVHGTGIIESLEETILMRNEAKADLKTVFHRYVKPLWIWKLDTDDATQIATFKAKADQTVTNSENIYIPKDAAEAERVSVPQYSTLDPLPWIDRLTNDFYQSANIPDIILGSAKQTVEASAKILYLAFQQSIEKNQLFLEENILAQLGFKVNFEFPASIEAQMQEQQKKEGKPKMKPSDAKIGKGVKE